MTREAIAAHIHYSPLGLPCVCGFTHAVLDDADETDTDGRATHLIRRTTDISRVTCVECAHWVCRVADTTILRIARAESGGGQS